MNESVERRVFGAIEFTHAVTGARVTQPLRLRADGVQVVGNARGLYVIRALDGQDAYTRAFDDPPTDPPRADVAFLVDDPQQRFAPRAFTLALPRRLPSPAAAVPDADNALQPVAVALWPAAALPLRAAWAVLRLRVVAGTGDAERGLVNVLVEAAPQVAGLPAVHAITDRQGEALVVVADVPPVLPGSGSAALTTEFALALTLVLDAQVVRDATADDIPVPDPSAVLARRDAGDPQVTVIAGAEQRLSAGASRRHVETVTWP